MIFVRYVNKVCVCSKEVEFWSKHSECLASDGEIHCCSIVILLVSIRLAALPLVLLCTRGGCLAKRHTLYSWWTGGVLKAPATSAGRFRAARGDSDFSLLDLRHGCGANLKNRRALRHRTKLARSSGHEKKRRDKLYFTDKPK